MKFPGDVDRAVSVLRTGGVIAMPTDTLYALVADATDAEAVERVFSIKAREAGKPLPLFVGDLDAAIQVAIFNQSGRQLATRFWPGALTIVLPTQASFKSRALASGRTVALRVPDQDTALAIIRKLGRPVTATSANLSGGIDPISADEVNRQLGDAIDFVVEAGSSPEGRSSTIVDCTGDEVSILRHGAISQAAIDAALAELDLRTAG